jgi:hypothetical protein
MNKGDISQNSRELGPMPGDLVIRSPLNRGVRAVTSTLDTSFRHRPGWLRSVITGNHARRAL